ncbi:MAG: hypothetical protein Kow0069_16620 [Promethearchaeota archaeon]
MAKTSTGTWATNDKAQEATTGGQPESSPAARTAAANTTDDKKCV